MSAVLRGMQELLGAEDILKKLHADLAVAEENLPSRHNGTMALPSVGEVEVRGKAFVQRIEHALQAIFQLTVVFYGDMRKPGFLDGVAAHVRENFPDNEGYIIFADRMATFAKLIRGLRHSIEHRKPAQKVDWFDFHFAAGEVQPPTVHVTHRDVPFTSLPLYEFMESLIGDLVYALEALVVHVAASNITHFGKMPVAVGEHPQFGHENDLVRYTYLIGIGDPPEWRPLG